MPLHHRPLLLSVICVVLIMINSTKMSDSFLSGASSASYGVVEPSYSKLTEGSTLAINCTLTTYALTPLRSEALYFMSIYKNVQTRVNDTYYHIVNQSTMEMVIPDVKREDGTTFKCFIEDKHITGESFDSLINLASADIGEAPYPIGNISFVSDNFVSMTVEWCPEVYQEDPVYSTLFWQLENSPARNSGYCTVWTNIRRCACVFCSSPESGVCVNESQTFHRYQNYLINITSTNQFGRTEFYVEVYTSPKIVKPGPVTNLRVVPISSRELNVSWGIPDIIDETDIALYYQISASSKFGENILINVDANTSWKLTNLTPHTNYTVAVRCKPVEEGYWSDDSIAFGVTLEEAPEVPPNVPTGFFRLSECSDKCSITVFWQLIDERLQNGVVLGYNISMESAHCSPCPGFYVPGGSKTSAIISFASDFEFWIRLVAHTSVGDSPPQFIYFPSYFKSLPNIFNQDLYAEYTVDRTGVFFSWNYIEDVENYTFMYCHGVENDPNNCQDSPKDIFLSSHETNFTFNSTDPNFVYSLSANYRDGTNGLTAQWLCIYDYSGVPAKPNLLSKVQMSDTSIKISWDALQCSSVNRVRVFQYVLNYVPNTTGVDIGGNIELPGNTTEHVVTGLSPGTLYVLTLYAVSRSGPGPNTTDDIQTVLPKSENIIPVAVGSTIAALVAIALIVALIVIIARRCSQWCTIEINPPNKHVGPNIPNDSSAMSDNYVTVMENSGSLNGVCYPPSNSSDAPILQLSCSENENSEGSTETSAISDSIQTYTAIINNESSTETADPNCICHSTNQCSDSNRLQSFSLDMESDSCDSFGYSQQGKCTDSKNDSSVLNNNSLDQSHASVASLESSDSFDDYKKTELRDCRAELTGPPIEPQMIYE